MSLMAELGESVPGGGAGGGLGNGAHMARRFAPSPFAPHSQPARALMPPPGQYTPYMT